MVWGRFADYMQTCIFSLVFKYFNRNFISLDSQRRMLYDDTNYGIVENKIKEYTKQELKNCNFLKSILN